MYTVTVFQNAEELLKAASRVRAINDGGPILPSTVYLVFDGDSIRLSGDGSRGFDVDQDVTKEDLIRAAFQLAGIDVHIT